MNTLTIKVKGMVCNGCENRIQNALKRVEGINEVLADHEQELVTIKTNKKVDKNTIYEKIESLGFKVERED